MSQQNERRKSLRAPLLCTVTVYYGEQVLMARMVDLSLTGAFLETRHELPDASRCLLSFTLPKERLIKVEAVVCYQHPGLGVGIEFVDLSSANQEAIEACLKELN